MTEIYPQIVSTRRVVPNIQPVADPTPYRIALIGEAPGQDEENHGYPFCGKSGMFLNAVLDSVGIARNRCLVGNICQVRPPKNEISLFSWDGPEIQSGLKALYDSLLTFNPHICVLLGGTALRAAKGPGHSITAWRGSLFRGSDLNSPFYGRKCIGTLHPAAVLREFSGFPLLRFDLARALSEGTTPSLQLQERDLITNLDAGTLIHVMDTWPAGLPCSVDIEGGLPHHVVNDGVKRDAKKRRHLGWRCVAISGRPTKAFAIAWWKFNPTDEALLMQSFARLMYREDVPKVLQNSLYDMFVLEYGWAIPVRGLRDDTMLKGWEVYSELPKGLSTLASIWTREPHWKDDEMYESTGENLAIGCCKDTAVTLEISNAQDSALTGLSQAHYRTNISMLNPLLYMEHRGINYDQANVAKALASTSQEIAAVGDTINRMAGRELRGEKGSLSSQRLAKCLYEEKGYPPQYKKEGGKKTDKYTTDVEALLGLRRKLPGDDLLNAILRHRHLEGVIETLSIKPDSDGRVRCGYNVVGTETGRLTCYTSPTGAGANLQTITKKLRLNYRADPGYDFFQCDLAGADGWTVAAHCARLGDDTMLQDYYAGLKPAKIIGMLYAFGREVNQLERADLKFWSKGRVDKTHPPMPWDLILETAGKWVYDGCKVVQHGRSYLMGYPTMITNLMRRSFKDTGTPVYMEHRDAVALGTAMDSRYPGLATWHKWAEAELIAKGELTSASGQTRVFFGRRYGNELHDTVKEFLAHEPQSNTTWATNLAMLRLWTDPANRIVFRLGSQLFTGDGTEHHIPGWTSHLYSRLQPGALLVEPLHQVHDALCGQWPSWLRQWARRKVKEWFNNPLKIAGLDLVIPFDGAWGPSWGEQPNAL